jgi:hypothetical protein
LRRLRTTRFLAVVGTSGSGKSSLVRSGLIPSLQSGFMAGVGSGWRIAVMRPGEDPVGNLAASIGARDILGIDAEEFASTNAVLAEATLRRGPLGLADAIRQSSIPKGDSLIVIVDQFEELFRFRRGQHANSRDEAIAFVRLLLEASRQPEVPAYIALTMRSDFIGDCMDFPGLSEAVNDGLYLVGRMSRDSLRKAITGPVAVGGATIAPRLVHRVLNDLGDDHDQLPLVQHALMRTWDHWETRGQPATPIDVGDYEAIGTFRSALSMHAEEAYQEAAAKGAGRTAERMFKALTDTFSDPRGVRRPTSIAELALICEVAEAEIISAVNVFRRVGRSFLMPPAATELSARSIVDLSHESLMRCWTRLIVWAEEERESATFYTRLSQAAAWFAAGSAGLWRNPELELANTWRASNRPVAAWAQRYHEGFEQAIAFLDRSLEARADEEAARERERRGKLRRARLVAAVLAVFLIAAGTFGYLAWRERIRAEGNLALARAAVDQSLSSADREQGRVGGDLPQVEELRRELLQQAGVFYAAFLKQAPGNEASKRDAAFGHFRMGQINRLSSKPDDAAREYQLAIAAFGELAASYPANAEYRSALGSAYNWLGETLRPQSARSAEAQNAYESALRIQDVLARENPANAQFTEDLARSHYNRGILFAGRPDGGPSSEVDFREAIGLLEPLAASSDHAAQELARVYNNLGSLLFVDPQRAADVQALWEKAIAIDERLSIKDPSNREYKMELAAYCGNLAPLLLDTQQAAEAERRSKESADLLEALVRVGPSLGVARADAHSLRGMILAPSDRDAAEREFTVALDLFDQIRGDPNVLKLSEFHQRFADLLLDLAVLPASAARGRPLLDRGVSAYAEIAARIAASGQRAEALSASGELQRILPEVPEPEKTRLAAIGQQLQQGVTR